jgi:hypothetical protein
MMGNLQHRSETLDQFTYERVHRDHPFGLELRHVNRPMIRASGMEPLVRQISRLADAQAGLDEEAVRIRPCERLSRAP